jgi:hypothetical protein
MSEKGSQPRGSCMMTKWKMVPEWVLEEKAVRKASRESEKCGL